MRAAPSTLLLTHHPKGVRSISIDPILRQVADWAAETPDVMAVVLVGSHARGTASTGSDVDLVFLCMDPGALLRDISWTREFGQARTHAFETWGDVAAVRVHYRDGMELEFGLAGLDWAASRVNDGTAQVIRAGARVLLDRGLGMEARIQAARDSLPSVNPT